MVSFHGRGLLLQSAEEKINLRFAHSQGTEIESDPGCERLGTSLPMRLFALTTSTNRSLPVGCEAGGQGGREPHP